MPTATTYLKSHKRADKRTALQSLKDRFDYGLNPEKLGAVSSYLCDPATAHAEFMLVKNQYQGETDRRAGHGALCYQIRQAFPHGEVTAEEANRIGYETAMRWTKGKYAFFVATHTDKAHIHNHIYCNSTSLDCTRKYRDFLGSARALRKLSDRVCIEHGLSVIQNPKLKSQGRFRHYGQWLGADKPLTHQEKLKLQIDLVLAEGPADFSDFLRRMETAGYEVKEQRGAISFRAPGQERFTRLRAETLGMGYGPEDIRAVLGGKDRVLPRRKISLAIDIQARMQAGKGPGYERWAKTFNVKQMAAALAYIQEHGLTDYAELADRAAKATDSFHTLEWQVKNIDADLQRNSEIMGAVVNYAKTRSVFEGYKASRYSKKYLAEHEADIQTHREARAAFSRLLAGGKLPSMDALKAERKKLTTERRDTLQQYKEAKADMREIVTIKANIDRLLAVTGDSRNKEMER